MSEDISRSIIEEKSDASEVQWKNKRTLSVVPWYNAAQFRKVYECLYDEKIEMKIQAQDIISVWETRGTLSAAIEASYVLNSAIIQDILWTNESSFNHYNDIQGIYASAITRFVNVLVEVHQNRPMFRPVVDIAKGLGIPLSIVELRNESSHSARPSLSLLRIAAKDAMNYLKTAFWEKEAPNVNNYVKTPSNDDSRIRQLFKEFIIVKLEALRHARHNSDISGFERDLTLALSRMRYHIKKNKYLFVKILTMDGIFIPDFEDFKQLVNPRALSGYLNDCHVVPDLRATPHDQDSDIRAMGIPLIPDIHEQLWVPVIFELNRGDAVTLFMETLLLSQADRTVIGQKLIIAWVLEILTIHFHPRTVERSHLKKVFCKKGIFVNWRRMYHSAFVRPSKYASLLLPILHANVDWNADVKRYLANLLAIYQGQLDNIEKLPRKKALFTAEDLRFERSAIIEERRKRNGIPTENIWPICSDENHKFWPVGFIRNAIEDANDDDEEYEEYEEEEYFDNTDINGKNLPMSNDDNESTIKKIDVPFLVFPSLEDIRKAYRYKISREQ